MKKRATIELSANFLVVVIISIVILVLGLALFMDVLDKTHDQTTFLDDRIKNEIESLLMNSGERVVLPMNREEASAGDLLVFGLGVTNVVGTDKDFYILAECDAYIDQAGNPGSCGMLVKGLDINDNIVDTREIKNTERKIFGIVLDFDPHALKGTYVFNVNVCYNGPNNNDPECSGSGFSDLYGRIHKIYVEIT